MFHKSVLDQFAYDDDNDATVDDEYDNDGNNNPVGPIIAAS